MFSVAANLRISDPLPIEAVAGLFLVQEGEAPGGKGKALLIDRKGEVRHSFGRQVVGGIQTGQDRIFLTSANIVKVSSDDSVRWTIPFSHRQWIRGATYWSFPAAI